MQKYLIGESFYNSNGSKNTITNYNSTTKVYSFRSSVNGGEYTTTEYTIDNKWTKIETGLYNLTKLPEVGDYIHRDPEFILDSSDRLKFLNSDNTPKTFKVTMVNSLGIQINEVGSDKHSCWDQNKFHVLNPNNPDFSKLTQSVTVAVDTTANPNPIIKETKPMATKSIKDTTCELITDNKNAAINAAELKAGQIINKQVIKLLTPQLPFFLQGYAKSPLAAVVLANVAGFALKQYAPDNKKINKLATLMLNAAAFDSVDSFNIDQLVEDLMSSIKLPAGVSLED